MVSPQPIETLNMDSIATSSSKHAGDSIAAPSPTMQSSLQKSTRAAHDADTTNTNNTARAAHLLASSYPSSYLPAHLGSVCPPPALLKRTTSFIPSTSEVEATQPYLWSLYDDLPADLAPHAAHIGDELPHALASAPQLPSSPTADLFAATADPAAAAHFGAFDEIDRARFAQQPYFSMQPSGCMRCRSHGAPCKECVMNQPHSLQSGWAAVDPSHVYDDAALHSYIKSEPFAPLLSGVGSWVEADAMAEWSLPHSSEEAKSLAAADPMALSRVQGKLTRFLPIGQDMMAVNGVDPNYTTAFAHQSHGPSAHGPSLVEGRSMRMRKPVIRSRSPSPDLSERSATPESFASDTTHETDHYDHDDDNATTATAATTPALHAQVNLQEPAPLDDTLSPPTVRYDDSSSGQSSSEPPAPTRLLPVSARDLLPSRPSTAAIPPAHIKDRLVKSAKKLLTAADGVDDSVQVQVIPIWYPSKLTPGAHKIRLIRVENIAEPSVSVFAHAADVGGVVERKSNISRLFGKFESPSEKLLMNVVGAHNHRVGQESNILTSKGVRKFLATNKMKDETAYRTWITDVLLPQLLHDPLEIGEEEVEIEASTDPLMPHHIKPKKMKRMEKKRERKLAEQKSAESASAGAQQPTSSSPTKRPKLPTPSPTPALFLSPSMMTPFGVPPFIMPTMPTFSIGLNTPVSHAA